MSTLEHLRAAEAEMLAADESMAGAPRKEEVTSPLHTAMIYLEQSIEEAEATEAKTTYEKTR